MNTASESKIAANRKVSKRPYSVQGGSSEANRLAVVILEVLAGGRTPTDAAQALSITLPRYYQLEARALQGLVAALEPRSGVRQPSPASRIAQLEKLLNEARRDGLRQQALVRAAQRTLGIRAPAVETKPTGKCVAKHRKRRPVARALKAAEALAKATRQTDSEVLQQKNCSASRSGEFTSDGNGKPPDALSAEPKGTLG
jgi:hypothetical protein